MKIEILIWASRSGKSAQRILFSFSSFLCGDNVVSNSSASGFFRMSSVLPSSFITCSLTHNTVSLLSCALNFKTSSLLRFSSLHELVEGVCFDRIVSISLASSSSINLLLCDLALRLACNITCPSTPSSSSALPWMATSKGGLPRASEYDGTRTKLVRDRKLEDVTLTYLMTPESRGIENFGAHCPCHEFSYP